MGNIPRGSVLKTYSLCGGRGASILWTKWEVHFQEVNGARSWTQAKHEGPQPRIAKCCHLGSGQRRAWNISLGRRYWTYSEWRSAFEVLPKVEGGAHGMLSESCWGKAAIETSPRFWTHAS